MQQRMSVVVFTFALTIILGPVGTAALAGSDESAMDLNSPDVVKSVLEQQVGKRVRIKLESGQDLEGKVTKVGSHAVQLVELTGMEFFDATVMLYDIAAVIVRVRTK